MLSTFTQVRSDKHADMSGMDLACIFIICTVTMVIPRDWSKVEKSLLVY